MKSCVRPPTTPWLFTIGMKCCLQESIKIHSNLVCTSSLLSSEDSKKKKKKKKKKNQLFTYFPVQSPIINWSLNYLLSMVDTLNFMGGVLMFQSLWVSLWLEWSLSHSPVQSPVQSPVRPESKCESNLWTNQSKSTGPSPSRCTLAKATDQHHECSPLARLVSGLRPSRWGPSGWTNWTWFWVHRKGLFQKSAHIPMQNRICNTGCIALCNWLILSLFFFWRIENLAAERLQKENKTWAKIDRNRKKKDPCVACIFAN